MFLYIKPEYMSDEEWKGVDWGILKTFWPSKLEEEKPKDSWNFYSHEPIRVTIDEAQGIADSGVKAKLVAPPGNQFTKLRDRSDWEPDARILPEHLTSGKAVQISVADIGLMLIDEVTWVEDCCTEELQRMLDRGWRILAVCPPCAQRRPDYILGRRKCSVV